MTSCHYIRTDRPGVSAGIVRSAVSEGGHHRLDDCAAFAPESADRSSYAAHWCFNLWCGMWEARFFVDRITGLLFLEANIHIAEGVNELTP
jgi:hypothetical protein